MVIQCLVIFVLVGVLIWFVHVRRNVFLQSCKIHPECAIAINLNNGLYCEVCHDQVMDYEVFRTDNDREI